MTDSDDFEQLLSSGILPVGRSCIIDDIQFCLQAECLLPSSLAVRSP